jgi:hypothetical protein
LATRAPACRHIQVSFVDGGAAADTIVRKDGLSFIAQGFKRGQTLRVRGTPDWNSDQTRDNHNEFTITNVTDTTITDFGCIDQR